MKTIYDQLEEEEALLEPAEIVEEVPEEDPVIEETVEETTEEDPEVVETKVEEPVKEELKFDNEAMARMRWENSELKRQQREAQEAAQNAIRLQQQPVNTDPEPNKAEDREEWLDWKARQLEKDTTEIKQWKQQQQEVAQKNELIQGAIQEFQGYEANFKAQAPDYDEAAAFVRQRVTDSIALLNPNLAPAQLNQMVANQLLRMASNSVNQGINPAAAVYDMAKRQGFTKEAPKETEAKTVSKASLETVDKNKKKSANGLGGSGGKSTLTIAALEKMSVKELDAMDSEEVDSILYG